jgi:hypothetical protein
LRGLIPPKIGTKSNGYENYLFYKKLIEILSNEPSGRKEIAAAMGLEPGQVSHGVRILLQNKVIKICRYEVARSSKREIFCLLK